MELQEINPQIETLTSRMLERENLSATELAELREDLSTFAEDVERLRAEISDQISTMSEAGEDTTELTQALENLDSRADIAQSMLEEVDQDIEGRTAATEAQRAEIEQGAQSFLQDLSQEEDASAHPPTLAAALQAMSVDVENKSILFDAENGQLAITDNATGETTYVGPDGQEVTEQTFDQENAVPILENGQVNGAGMNAFSVATMAPRLNELDADAASRPAPETTPEVKQPAEEAPVVSQEQIEQNAQAALQAYEESGMMETVSGTTVTLLQEMTDLDNKTIQIDPESNQLAITNTETGETRYTTQQIVTAPVAEDGAEETEPTVTERTFNPENAVTLVENGQVNQEALAQWQAASAAPSATAAPQTPESDAALTEERRRTDDQILRSGTEGQGFMERLEGMDFSSNPEIGMLIQVISALFRGDMDGVMDAIENGVEMLNAPEEEPESTTTAPRTAGEQRPPQTTPETTTPTTAEPETPDVDTPAQAEPETTSETAEVADDAPETAQPDTDTPDAETTSAALDENDVGGVDGSAITYVVTRDREQDIPVEGNNVILATVTGEEGAQPNLLAANFANNVGASGVMVDGRIDTTPEMDNAFTRDGPGTSIVMQA